MKKLTKKQSEAIHAKLRAIERYGVSLNNRDLEIIVGRIKNGNSKTIEKQSNRVSVHKVEYQGVEMIAVYDKHRKMIITFLPKEDEE